MCPGVPRATVCTVLPRAPCCRFVATDSQRRVQEVKNLGVGGVRRCGQAGGAVAGRVMARSTTSRTQL